MNKQEMMSKMVPPGKERPGIWRKGVMQVWVTRACDRSCSGCTQASNLAGKPGMITVEQYAQALDSLKGYFGVIGMFGGNPAIHPRFRDLCQILVDKTPYEQRGLWCNHPLTIENTKTMRATFNPNVSNLNLHQDESAYRMFYDYWPECRHQLKGLTHDSEHVSWWRSPLDWGVAEEERRDRIATCDVNQYWSAMIYPFRGRLVGSICEIMGAMDMMKEDDPTWPDHGIDVTQEYWGKKWWQLPIESFGDQVESHCHHCAMPYKDRPVMANGNEEETTEFWKDVVKPKKRDKLVTLVNDFNGIKPDYKQHSTDYVVPHRL